MGHCLTDKVRINLLCIAIALCVTAKPLFAQTIPEIDNLATRAAERVAKTDRQHIFVLSHLSCQLDMELCTAFEGSLRLNLEKMVPGLQFVRRDDVTSVLTNHGFVALDVYNNNVLESEASEAGAEILVTNRLQWQRDGYELTSEVLDATKHKKLVQFRTKIARSVPDSGGIPLVIKDQDTGVSLLIYRGVQPKSSTVWYPKCEKCPDPSYTPKAREEKVEGSVVMLVTITEQGTAEHVSVIKGLKDGLTDQAVEAVRSWHFKPAIGVDGKPFATRVPIEMTFSLHG